jgi:hypothetical protein
VNPEISRADHQIAPDTRDQIPMTDDLTGALDQRNQDVQRAISQCERHTISLDLAFRRR